MAARSIAMGLLLGGAVLLASQAAEPVERRVSWRGVSFVLPGGFVPDGNQRAEVAMFRDRLRFERKLHVFRLRASPGSAGEAEPEDPALADPPAHAAAPATAYPGPEAILRFMFPRLLQVLPLPADATVEEGTLQRQDGTSVPFAAWVGIRDEAEAATGRAPQTLYGVMVTTDGRGAYAVLVIRDPAYEQDQLGDRVQATLELLNRTLETVEFRDRPEATS